MKQQLTASFHDFAVSLVCEPIKGGDHASQGPDIKARVDLCGAGQQNILAEAPGEQSYVGEVPGRGPVE
jgi:hypothetical protein